MIRLALRSLRRRLSSFTATFVAVLLGAAVVTMCGGLLETGIRLDVAPSPGQAPIVVAGVQTYAFPVDDGEEQDDMPLAELQRLDPAVGAAIASVPGLSVEQDGQTYEITPAGDVTAAATALETALKDQPVRVLTGDDRGLAEHPEAVGGREGVVAMGGVFGGVAVLVAVFVIAGTLNVGLQQRRRELGLLRAVGATPRQVRTLVVREAMAVSVVAAGLGTGLGVLGGRLLYDRIAAAGVITPAVQWRLGWLPCLVGGAAALLVALVGAHVAARRPSRTKPGALLAEASVGVGRVGKVRIAFAVVFFLMGVALMVVTAVVMGGQLASATAGPAVMCWAIAAALMAPALTRVLARLLAGPVRRLSGPAGELAATTVQARTARLAGVVTAVMLAVGIAVADGYEASTQAAAAHRWFDVEADAVATSPVGFTAADEQRARTVPGVTAAGAYTRSQGWIDHPYDPTHTSTAWELEGVGDPRIAGITPTAGSLSDLHGDAVAAPNGMHLELGEVITMRYGDRSTGSLRVVALYDGHKGYGQLVLPAAALAPHTTAGAPTQLVVLGTPDRGALARALPRADFDQELATPASGTEVQTWVDYLLIAVIAGYAMIAVVNSLVTATAARRRELGVQRLIGATKAQVARMLAVEASMTAVIGILIGTVAALATLVPFAATVLGSPVPAGSPALYLGVVGLAVALTLAATLLPARRILAVRPAEAAASGLD